MVPEGVGGGVGGVQRGGDYVISQIPDLGKSGPLLKDVRPAFIAAYFFSRKKIRLAKNALLSLIFGVRSRDFEGCQDIWSTFGFYCYQ